MGASGAPAVVVVSAEVRLAGGRLAATVDRVDIGGGSQTVMVDGVPEERIHPSRQTWHVRMLAPSRMQSDELREVDDYEQAVALGVAYAGKLIEHAAQVEALAGKLTV